METAMEIDHTCKHTCKPITDKNNHIVLVNPINYSLRLIDQVLASRKNSNADFRKSLDLFYSPPLGILYLAGIAKQQGYTVQIVDLHKRFCEAIWSETFLNSTIYEFVREELSHIITTKPAIVGISSLFSMASSVSHIVAKALKTIDSTILCLNENPEFSRRRDRGIGDTPDVGSIFPMAN